MCENRERLIGFVYGECDSDERRAIEEHLTSCHTCRQEIRGLQSVRQDLLSWEVPSSEPAWRPAAPPREESPWRAVPAWAMAAAASAVLMVGAGGGAATYALLSAPQATVAESSAQATAVPVGGSPVDLSALEARLVARMRAELDERVRLAAAGPATPAAPAAAVSNAATSDLARRVNVLSTRQDELYDLLLGVANETLGIRSKQTGLERDNRMLVSYMQGQGSGGFIGGR